MEIAKAWHKYTVEGIYSADMFEAITEIHSQYMKALYDSPVASKAKPIKTIGDEMTMMG